MCACAFCAHTRLQSLYVVVQPGCCTWPVGVKVTRLRRHFLSLLLSPLSPSLFLSCWRPAAPACKRVVARPGPSLQWRFPSSAVGVLNGSEAVHCHRWLSERWLLVLVLHASSLLPPILCQVAAAAWPSSSCGGNVPAQCAGLRYARLRVGAGCE